LIFVCFEPRHHPYSNRPFQSLPPSQLMKSEQVDTVVDSVETRLRNMQVLCNSGSHMIATAGDDGIPHVADCQSGSQPS
jgi:hypothetical protein